MFFDLTHYRGSSIHPANVPGVADGLPARRLLCSSRRRQSKRPDEINSPGLLFWRRPTLAQPIVALPSGLQRFTSVFGMGTGGATALGSPEIRPGLAVTVLRADAD